MAQSVSIFPTHRNDKEEPSISNGLRPKEESFALHLVTLGDPVKAYLEAGYQGKDYEETRKLAYDLWKKEEVKALFQSQLDYNRKRYSNENQRIIQELESIAFSTVDDFVIKNGELKLKPGRDHRAYASLKSIKSITTENHRTGNTDTKVEFVMGDKLKALELLARHSGLLDATLPPIDILLARLPRELQDKLREVLAGQEDEPLPLTDNKDMMVDESFVDIEPPKDGEGNESNS